jgi:tetratricopeptide (TPR) repeat protein
MLTTGRAEKGIALLIENPLPDALFTLGWTHLVLGDADSANRAWDSWLKTTLNASTNKLALSLFRFLLSNQTLKAMPDVASISIDAMQELEKWLLLLLLYHRHKEVDRVICQAPLLIASMWPTLRMRWAQALILNGHISQGLPLLIETAKENPDSGPAYYWLGYCAMLQQQTDDAQLMFNECLRCEPDHPQANQALALLKEGTFID